MVFVSWRAGVRRKAVEDSDEGQERLRRDGLIEDEQKELRSRFEDAFAHPEDLQPVPRPQRRWRNELPWYLLIGPQEAAIPACWTFSGLEFPINRIDRKLTRDTAGTRYCDWYFADRRPDRHRRALPELSRRRGRRGALGDPDRLLRGAATRTTLGMAMVSIQVETLASATTGAGYAGSLGCARLQEIKDPATLICRSTCGLSKADLASTSSSTRWSREVTRFWVPASARSRTAQMGRFLLQAFEDLLRRLNSQVISASTRSAIPRVAVASSTSAPAWIRRAVVPVRRTRHRQIYQRASRLRGFYLTSAPAPAQQLDEVTAGIGSNLGSPGLPDPAQQLMAIHTGSGAKNAW